MSLPLSGSQPGSRLEHLAGLLGFSFVAFFGTAILESPFSHLYNPHSIFQAFGKAYLLSFVLSALLGYLIYRRWQPSSALWVWLVGVFWFTLRMVALAFTVHASFWQQLTGSVCLSHVPSISISCTAVLASNLAVLRPFAFTFGAILCAALRPNGSRKFAGAAFGNFAFPKPSANVLEEEEATRRKDWDRP